MGSMRALTRESRVCRTIRVFWARVKLGADRRKREKREGIEVR